MKPHLTAIVRRLDDAHGVFDLFGDREAPEIGELVADHLYPAGQPGTDVAPINPVLV